MSRVARRCEFHEGIDCLCADLETENGRLREALKVAADRLGDLSSVLSRSNQNHRAHEVWMWAREASAALD